MTAIPKADLAAVGRLKALGYANVHVLAGGLNGWALHTGKHNFPITHHRHDIPAMFETERRLAPEADLAWDLAWCHSIPTPPDGGERLREIVRHAALAPSGHNEQPWRFGKAAA